MVLSLLKSTFKSYSNFIQKKPFVGISLSTGVILGLGDILEQAVEGKQYDYKRTLSMGFYGLALYGPFCCFWYNRWLPKLAPLSEIPLLKQLSFKIFLDETIQSTFFYGSFLYVMTLLEGGSHQQGKEKVKSDFMRCYLADLAVWPWIQYLNFMYIPPHLQAIVVSAITVFWGAYISYVQHSTSPKIQHSVKDTLSIIPSDSLQLLSSDPLSLIPSDPISLLRSDPISQLQLELFNFQLSQYQRNSQIMFQ